MIMRKRVIVPIGEATAVILPHVQILNEVYIDIQDILHSIINHWLHNGASLSVDQAVQLVTDRCLDEITSYTDLEADSDKVLEALIVVEDAIEKLMAALKPFFDLVDYGKGEYPPSHTEIVGGNDHDIHLMITIRSPKQYKWRRNVPPENS